ncbi:MAG: hypothetical protein QHH24_03585 [Candidatus Bathyarchaeota archaeon]|jgi:hypothetical protein|nr:hypothetical protein [Candidatus Bathyarchaeota archaeon]
MFKQKIKTPQGICNKEKISATENIRKSLGGFASRLAASREYGLEEENHVFLTQQINMERAHALAIQRNRLDTAR